MLLGNGLMISVLFACLYYLPVLAELSFAMRVVAIIFVCGTGAVVYVLGLLVAGMRPADLRQAGAR